jgi:limonene-1,2-epoxide hydrolase
LAFGATGALLSFLGTAHADEPALSQIEADNTKIVNDFCAAWATLDAAKIAEFAGDKIVYQVIDNMPLVKGKEGLTKFITPFLASVEKADWEIKRSHAIGNLVINERVDNFYFKGDKKKDAHYKVVGLFLLKDGKIQEWKDYRLPGEKG